jgi:5'-3' exonuclease
MGIRNLHDFLRKTIPCIYRDVSLSEFAFKTIAIDLSIYLCKYKSSYKEKWLDAFLNMMCQLRKNDIHFICIFDSKSPPEKDNEKKMRQLQRERLKSKVTDMRNGLLEFRNTGVLNSFLTQYIKKKNRTFHCNQQLESFLIDEIDRLDGNILDIQGSDFELLKELFTILNVPFFWAHSEAEATCAHLCLNGVVDAVMTEDTDILAYGCPIFLHRINISNNSICQIKMVDVLRNLELNYKEFLDFCIMCGTDYNTNIRNIGNESSYRLIKEHGSIDRLTNLNVSVLNHVRVRELFMNDIQFELPKESSVVCGHPDKNRLHFFLFNNNCSLDTERIMDAFMTSNSHLEFQTQKKIK